MLADALRDGAIWSVLWSVYIYLILKFFPYSMLHDYPKDIQAAAETDKPTGKQDRAAKLFGAIGGLVIFGVLILFGLLRFHSEPVPFMKLLTYIFIVAMTWNVADLLIIDWFIICLITPEWVVIKGTEGCRGYKDYLFHFKGFLIGCIYTAIMALLFAGADYGILRLLIWDRSLY